MIIGLAPVQKKSLSPESNILGIGLNNYRTGSAMLELQNHQAKVQKNGVNEYQGPNVIRRTGSATLRLANYQTNKCWQAKP